MCPHGPIDEVSLAQHMEDRPHRKLLHGHHEHDGPPHEPHGAHHLILPLPPPGRISLLVKCPYPLPL